MELLDLVVEFLADGKWHSIKEITKALNLPRKKLMVIVNFYVEYAFMDIYQGELGGVKIRLASAFQDFIKKIKWIERSELVSNP